MTKSLSSPNRPPRVSVPLDAETLQAFERLAKAGNMSTGKAIAEWLRDTTDAAQLMASTMERARAAPKIVTAELHAMMLGLADQTKELQDKYSKFKGSLPGAGEAQASARPTAKGTCPPPCNTGGKVSQKPTKQRTKGSS